MADFGNLRGALGLAKRALSHAQADRQAGKQAERHADRHKQTPSFTYVRAMIWLPDHYGCGLGCALFTGTLAAVEEHERGCARWLHNFLPEDLHRDLFSGDEDELALTLLDIVEPLQYPLSVLQKARRHVLASPPLVASDEMTPLEPADRHPAPSQKLPTSKQSIPPAAPASAPPLSSASIAPNPLFLNLLPINPASQTGDSNLVADKTINSNNKETVPQQQGHSLLPLPVNGSGQPLLSQEMMQKTRKLTPVSRRSSLPMRCHLWRRLIVTLRHRRSY